MSAFFYLIRQLQSRPTNTFFEAGSNAVPPPVTYFVKTPTGGFVYQPGGVYRFTTQ